ncbi:FtsB family cell division protein [Lachnospira multipara]|uniref:FtsB family cell division protein n=1 Tax=Lachnospira multipara TaxID=28051 RepID=UPI00041AC1F1|nr:septum formation initiator family protein [Lachnospira multipara]
MVRESRREKERRRKRQRWSTKLALGAAVAVLVMFALLLINNQMNLNAKNRELESQINEVQSQVDEETQRASDLEDYQEYIQSKKFVEEIAKNKFGLICPDEIIFKADE